MLKKIVGSVLFTLLLIANIFGQTVHGKNIELINEYVFQKDIIGINYKSKEFKDFDRFMYKDSIFLFFDCISSGDEYSTYYLNVYYLRHDDLIDSLVTYSIEIFQNYENYPVTNYDTTLAIYRKKFVYNHAVGTNNIISKTEIWYFNDSIVKSIESIYEYDSLNRIVHIKQDRSEENSFLRLVNDTYFHYNTYPDVMNIRGNNDYFIIDNTESFLFENIANDKIQHKNINDIYPQYISLYPPTLSKVKHQKLKSRILDYIKEDEMDKRMIETNKELIELFLHFFDKPSTNIVNELPSFP
ncbi:MAG: hypothetical protein K1X55_14835 [Chitinophagales bacterium]|nr:hypothetical protein [Chitinophagales bacterium]